MPTKAMHFSDQELSAIRKDTPGVEHVVHFNNAGAALMPRQVAAKISDYINQELLFGGYETAEHHAEEINGVYHSLAKYLGCSPNEIAIVENATVAWTQAFLSIPFQKGDVILTSMAEYASNYIAMLQLKKRSGVVIKAVPNDAYGQLDVAAMERMIDNSVKLIAITHVPTNGGLVNPAEAIGAVAGKHNIPYLLDACQSAGQMPLDVKAINCDFLSATSRKYFRGPRGVGFLYVNGRRFQQLEPPALDLHGASWKSPDHYEALQDARKFENWENNYAAILGFKTAVDYALSIGMERIQKRIEWLAGHLRSVLSAIPGVRVHDLGATKCGIVSFGVPLDVFDFKTKLKQNGFNVSIISPDGTLLDMHSRDLGHLIRASVHYYNTTEEIDRFADFIKKQLIA